MSKKNQSRKVEQPHKDYRQIMFEGGRRELIAAQMLMKKEFVVSMPIVDDRYDLVAEKNSVFYRIQVKSMNLEYSKDPDNDSSFDQWKILAYTTPNGIKMTYDESEIDFIFGIDIEQDNFAIIPIQNVPNSGIIRLSLHYTSKAREYINSFSALDQI